MADNIEKNGNQLSNEEQKKFIEFLLTQSIEVTKIWELKNKINQISYLIRYKRGDQSRYLFYYKDAKQIDVMDSDECVEFLLGNKEWNYNGLITNSSFKVYGIDDIIRLINSIFSSH